MEGIGGVCDFGWLQVFLVSVWFSLSAINIFSLQSELSLEMERHFQLCISFPQTLVPTSTKVLRKR